MPDERTPSTSLPELLAPAGGPDALKAAVRGGADAVYLGVGELNARQGAENFSWDGLAEACDFAHLRGVSIYLTANVLILPHEMRDALRLVERAWTAGVDAVILQDLGLLRAVSLALPDVRAHASTQIGAHNVATVRLLEELGVDRVTLARELSIEEISRISSAVDIECESFVHGALCMSYSGQCLFSSMVGGRSANRGACAQPCRLPYRLLDEDGEPVETDGGHLLSPRDLAGISVLPRLVGSAVSALKIEGRMKSPEYVALVVGVYRAAIDRAAADPEGFRVGDGEWEVLEEAFNRGFSSAYLEGIKDSQMMGRSRPNNRGVLIGRVASVQEGMARVKLDRAVDSDDRIEFWTSSGRFTQPVGEMVWDSHPHKSAPVGAEVAIVAQRPVRPGDRVFRVENARLIAAARRTFKGVAEPRPVQAQIAVDLRVGEPLRIEMSVDDVSVSVTGHEVEAARTRAVSADEVMEHVGRLGGTAYVPGSWDLSLDPRAGVGFSALHGIRREAVRLLDESRLSPWRARQSIESDTPDIPATHGCEKVELVAIVADDSSIPVALDGGADRVVVQYDPRHPRAQKDDRVWLLLPRIAHDDDVAALTEAASASSGVVTGNPGLASSMAQAGIPVWLDQSANISNPQAAASWAELGIDGAWASAELSADQLSALTARSPIPVGTYVLGAQELMVMEHCILQAAGECSRSCDSCDRRAEGWALEDRKGYHLPVSSDPWGRSHLFNPIPLDLTHVLPEVIESGVCAVGLDLRGLPGREGQVTEEVRRRLDAASAGSLGGEGRLLDPATGGHFFRGVG